MFISYKAISQRCDNISMATISIFLGKQPEKRPLVQLINEVKQNSEFGSVFSHEKKNRRTEYNIFTVYFKCYVHRNSKLKFKRHVYIDPIEFRRCFDCKVNRLELKERNFFTSLYAKILLTNLLIKKNIFHKHTYTLERLFPK